MHNSVTEERSLRSSPRRGEQLGRRHFLSAASAVLITTCVSSVAHSKPAASEKLLFASRGRMGLVDLNTLHVKYLELDAPGQATWQVAAVMPDRERLLMLSMEPRRDGPGKPFDEYYTQTPTHLWLYELTSGKLEEICHRDRLAPFVTPSLLIGDDRLLIQVVKNKVGQIFSVRLDGSDAREFTAAGEGLPYGLSLSPDHQRVAFHLASPQGYQVYTSDVDGRKRVQVAAKPGHLFFGTDWSPDGQSVVFADCLHEQDPGHDWADVCIGRADGSSYQVLTKSQAMWFAATYGDEKSRGGGSNIPSWTKDNKILFPRRSPNAKVPWAYRTGQPDLDHFNRDYQPELASGGVQLCELDPNSGVTSELTGLQNGVWDFRGTTSPDGKRIAFCRAETGQAPRLCVLDRTNRQVQIVTQGIDNLGADHPRWV